MQAPILKGQQVYLKELLEADVSHQYVQWLNTPEINQYLESRYQKQSTASCLKFIQNLQKQKNHCFWGVYCNMNNTHIGNIKLGPINFQYRRATIGLMIGDKDYWGKGIATEIINLVTQFSFSTLQLHKIDAGCYASNLGSKYAFLKAGYQVEGTLVDHFSINGSYEDCILLGKISNKIYESQQ